MQKVFYIFRHGETDYNLEHRWQGCGIDLPLNDNGIRQAQNLAQKLQDKKIEIIYSSPLKRAIQTAEIAAQKLKVEVKIIENLREVCLGKAEGKLRQEVEKLFPDIFETWYIKEEPLDIAFPEGETKQHARDRMFEEIKKLLRTPQNIIGISSHSAAMRYFLTIFDHICPQMANVAVFKLTYCDGSWSLEQNI